MKNFRIPKLTSDLSFSRNGNQKKWLVVLGIFVPILLSIWGLKISINSADNRESIEKLTSLVRNSKVQIDTLSNLVKNSQKQIEFLQKIYIATDSTNKSTSNLKELPTKLSILGRTIDVLNSSLIIETKKLDNSYGSLNKTYDQLIEQQKSYLSNIGKVVELTNQQIEELAQNNKTINSEFNRRSLIVANAVLKKNGDFYILEEVNLSNKGTIEFEIKVFDIIFDKINFVCPDYSKIDSRNIFTQIGESEYRMISDVNNKIVSNGRNVRITFQNGCYFKILPTEIEDFSNMGYLRFSLTYSNKYEDKTIVRDFNIVYR